MPEEHLLPFVPCSASEAKKKVMVNYYLNSPDAETQYMERVWSAYFPHYDAISRRVHELNQALRARPTEDRSSSSSSTHKYERV